MEATSFIGTREGMRNLPKIFRLAAFIDKAVQALITEATGKAYKGQLPLFKWSWRGRLALWLITLAGSIAVSALLARSAPWFWIFLPHSIALTIGSFRAAQTVWTHHAAHNNIARQKGTDRFIGDGAALLAMNGTFENYKSTHAKHHADVGGENDPDMQLLVKWGWKAGLTEKEYWIFMWTLVLNPMFHLRFLESRLRLNFFTGSWTRRLVFFAYFASHILITVDLGWAWFVAWWLPVTLGFQINTVMAIMGLHTWIAHDDKDWLSRQMAVTPAWYFGEKPPSHREGDIQAMAWSVWLVRMAVWHLPSRILWAPGDLPNHFAHHENTKSDWPNSAYVAQSLAETNPYVQEVWGWKAAVRRTFQIWGRIPKGTNPSKAKIRYPFV